MSPRLVFDGILDELESWNTDGVERQMVRASGVAHGECSHAEIFEGPYPRLEDGRDSGVLLQVDTANLARAIVDVEVGGDFCLLGLQRDWPGFAAKQCRHVFHRGIVHTRARPEVLLDISLRAEQTFFFAAPQSDADSAPRLDVEGLQYANGLHHDNASSSVIGGAGSGMPGIEMSAEH